MTHPEYIGIDLHRRRSVVVWMDAEGQVLSSDPIENDPEELQRLLAAAGPGPEVVLEATYGWYWAVDACQEVGARVQPIRLTLRPQEGHLRAYLNHPRAVLVAASVQNLMAAESGESWAHQRPKSALTSPLDPPASGARPVPGMSPGPVDRASTFRFTCQGLRCGYRAGSGRARGGQ